MRNFKLFAAALTLALTGAVYAAGAMQNAPKTQENAKAEKNCCLKHTGEWPTHAVAESGDEGCCARGASASEHADARAGARRSAAAGEKPGCCSADSSTHAGNGCCRHRAGGAEQTASHRGEGCCKEGAACCKGAGNDCCKAHKSDAAHAAVAGSTEEAASCPVGSHGCCGGKTQGGGR